MEENDYKDTINEINNAEDNAEKALQADKRRDAEIAYETLAVSSCMGMLGMEDEMAGLLQLQLTQEVFYKANQQNDDFIKNK